MYGSLNLFWNYCVGPWLCSRAAFWGFVVTGWASWDTPVQRLTSPDTRAGSGRSASDCWFTLTNLCTKGCAGESVCLAFRLGLNCIQVEIIRWIVVKMNCTTWNQMIVVKMHSNFRVGWQQCGRSRNDNRKSCMCENLSKNCCQKTQCAPFLFWPLEPQTVHVFWLWLQIMRWFSNAGIMAREMDDYRVWGNLPFRAFHFPAHRRVQRRPVIKSRGNRAHDHREFASHVQCELIYRAIQISEVA